LLGTTCKKKDKRQKENNEHIKKSESNIAYQPILFLYKKRQTNTGHSKLVIYKNLICMA
jgi:hypothetical protein